MNEHIRNKRLGFRTPRTVLLPPYFANNAYYVEYMEAIDEVFGPMIDDKLEVVKNLRNMFVSNPAMEVKIQAGEMINFSDWSQPERDILVKQANMLGMRFDNAGVLSNDAYQTVTRHVGEYWFGKGTESFVEFINYCLGVDLQVINLWTTDYLTFVPEGLQGTPIWEAGGTWYPTTHVELVANAGLDNLSIQALTDFFYEIANYNLVLHAVDASFDMWFTPDLSLDPPIAEIVAIGGFATNPIVISNQFSYGTVAPPTIAGDSIPTTYYGGSGFILGNPISWIKDSEGRKFPVYLDTTVTTAESIPTNLIGIDAPDRVIVGQPNMWINVPGSNGSSARLPAFTTNPVTTETDSITTNMVGTRNAVLFNPVGFHEIEPGVFIPYC